MKKNLENLLSQKKSFCIVKNIYWQNIHKYNILQKKTSKINNYLSQE